VRKKFTPPPTPFPLSQKQREPLQLILEEIQQLHADFNALRADINNFKEELVALGKLLKKNRPLLRLLINHRKRTKARRRLPLRLPTKKTKISKK